MLLYVPRSDGAECSLLVFTGRIHSRRYHRKSVAGVLVGNMPGMKDKYSAYQSPWSMYYEWGTLECSWEVGTTCTYIR